MIATVGPASDNERIIEKMTRHGLSTVRINSAHIEHGYIGRIARMVSSINSRNDMFLSVLVDLKGPELRTAEFPDGKMSVVRGKEYSIGDQSSDIPLNMPEIVSDIKEGDKILLSDGRISLKVISAGTGRLRVKALDTAECRSRSRVNIPGRILNLGVLTERDISFVEEAVQHDIDFFALSFVQKPQNVLDLRERLSGMGNRSHIVAKIETRSGLSQISKIAAVSDWIMVARGDLGVEIPLEDVVMAQKTIIRESHRLGVPTIVATQVLESMVENATPTRAEVSDITNAMMDNADSLMLSEETAVGKYPLESVRYLSRIANFVEFRYRNFAEADSFNGNHIAFSIALAAKKVASDVKADAILSFTRTGSTVRMISAARPESRIIAAVVDRGMARKLNLMRNVTPLMIPSRYSSLRSLGDLADFLWETGKLKFGSRVVVTSGTPYFLFGGTTDLRVLTIGSYIGRGYAIGKSRSGRFDPSGLKGIIFTQKLSMDQLRSDEISAILTEESYIPSALVQAVKGKTILLSTKIYRMPSAGEELMIDSGTGVVVSKQRKKDVRKL